MEPVLIFIEMNKKGFIALFTVMIIGFMATFFAVSSSVGVWFQSKSVVEAKTLVVARMGAMSCVNIARLKIYQSEIVDTHEYNIGEQTCRIEDMQTSGQRVFLYTSSGLLNAKIFLDVILDYRTLNIISIKER